MNQTITITVVIKEDPNLSQAIQKLCIEQGLSKITEQELHEAAFNGAIMTEMKAGRAEIKYN